MSTLLHAESPFVQELVASLPVSLRWPTPSLFVSSLFLSLSTYYITQHMVAAHLEKKMMLEAGL